METRSALSTDEGERERRSALAKIIERRSDAIVENWLEQVRADAAAARISVTDLRDGIHDYLRRLSELLEGGTSLDSVGSSAWSDIAREHAITRVRLSFDVSQLFHELAVLRRAIFQTLRADGAIVGADQDE